MRRKAFMNNQQAYNAWSESYDTAPNKTRDLEAFALRESLADLNSLDILEIGCGTGKNTEWLVGRAKHLVASDFSPEMLAKAKEKITAKNVEFRQFDLREQWEFAENQFDLITCSLALEHIENINFIFNQARRVLRANGVFYVGELHPFKQYLGSKARFETESGVFELECFAHHISEFFAAARSNDFTLVDLREWFDNDDKTNVPRLLTLVFKSEK